ncbi:MAG: T9SS type A sorting domain-containing protein [bacterium]|nr:T9SS type A sorting domain-containing protein [Candidatus Kapabacteria bacterium]
MLIEWLTPVELHGKEFVYTPQVDVVSPKSISAGELDSTRKYEFIRVYGTHEGETRASYDDLNGRHDLDPIEQSKVGEVRLRPYAHHAARFITSQPAQVMMSSAAVVKYAGTTEGGGYIGAKYDGWGGAMSELVPRDRWSTFAPFYASTHPAGMEHHINVVTDSAHRNDVFLKNGTQFVFDQSIPNTDLIWGTMNVPAGVDNWLVARNGARFSGYVYGTLTKGGHEQWRPGMVRDRDVDPPSDAHSSGDDARDADASAAMHPSEYEEYLGISYAYPLASLQNIITVGDSLNIRSTSDCSGTTLTITSILPDPREPDPVGLRSVRLENPINAKIASLNPFPVTGSTQTTVLVAAIDPRQDASATVVIMDRTGKIARVAFTQLAERIVIDPPARFDFDEMTPGAPRSLSLNVTNPLGRSVTVKNIRLINRNPAFSIVPPLPVPLTIAPNGLIAITVRSNPTEPDRVYIDTVEIELECTLWKIPVRAETSNPCVNVGDLDFGTLLPSQSRTLPLMICNDGGGVVTFEGQSGGSVIEWLLTTFTISQADIAKIADAQLSRGDCITINVTFTSPSEGVFRTTARLWASTRRCRDESNWIARVAPITAAPAETGVVNSLSAVEPNPFIDATDIAFSMSRGGHASLVVYDARGERVATLFDGERNAGTHVARFDAMLLPAGVYHVRLSVDGWSETRSVVKR